jgi:hypothetical protein
MAIPLNLDETIVIECACYNASDTSAIAIECFIHSCSPVAREAVLVTIFVAVEEVDPRVPADEPKDQALAAL